MAVDPEPDDADDGERPVDPGAESGRPAPATERSPTIPPAFESYATDDLPNATPRGHGKDGVLEAVLARAEGGPTRLVRDRAKVPLHLTGTLDHDPIGPTLCIQEPTGGVAQGDRHRIAIEARTGARGVVITQSATAVHSMHSDYVHLDAAIEAGPDAHLEYVPSPTIVNADARCLSTTRVDLAPGASAILANVLVPDGLSEHAPFGFDHYHASLEARHDGDLICADAIDLRPDRRDPEHPSTVGDANAVGTLYVLAPDGLAASGEASSADGDTSGADRAASTDAADDSIAALADRVHERVTDCGADDDAFRAGASVLPFEAGVGVRVVADGTAAVEAAVEAARDEGRRALYDVGVPDDRRY